jgi:hypothetical protein
MTYNQFSLEVMKLTRLGHGTDEIAEHLAEQMDKEPMQLLPFVQKVVMENAIIEVK